MTARKVIVQQGLYDTSMAKIAKAAKIPVGSIYTYFQSKEDLINFIYYEFKDKMGQYIFEDIPENINEKDELQLYWDRTMTFALNNIEDFLFAEQLVHSPFIQKETDEKIQQNFKVIFDLLNRGIENKVIKDIDPFIIHHIIYTNLTSAIKFIHFNHIQNPQSLQNLFFETCWDSIKYNN